MSAKHTLATMLGTLLAAALPAISHAESQSEWLLRQLQISDGYSPPPAQAMSKKEQAAKESPFEGTSLKGKQEKPAAPTYSSGGFQVRDDGRVFLPNGQEISAP